MGDSDKAAQYSEIWSVQQYVCLQTQMHILIQYSYLVHTQFIILRLLCFILHYSLPNFLLLLHFRILNMQKVLMHCRKKPAIHHLKLLFMNFYFLFIPSLNQICNCHLQFLIKYSNYTNF